MRVFKALREFLTGTYESEPFTPMSGEDAKRWVYENRPICDGCGQEINAYSDNYTLINDSVNGISVAHRHAT